MRVVFLSPVSVIGGAERVLIDLISSLRLSRPSWDLQVITPKSGPLHDALSTLGITVHVVPIPAILADIGDFGAKHSAGKSGAAVVMRLLRASVATSAYVKALRQVLCSLKPTIVHSNGLKMHFLACWSKPRRVPLVWHLHEFISSRPIVRHLIRFHASKCSLAITISHSVSEDIERVCGHRLKIQTIWNAVDLSEFSPIGPTVDLDTLCALEPPRRDTIRIGLIATFARWKGHEIFLRSLALVPPDLPIRAYIIGCPIYDTAGSQWSIQELIQLTNRLGLEHRVGFTGFIPHPARAIRTLDIVVHASTEPEPFGLVIAEAMAVGKPVITSGSGGVAEIVGQNQGAITYQATDPQALARLLTLLATNQNLRTEIGLVGLARAKNKFDRGRLGPAFARVYEAISGPEELAPEASATWEGSIP